MRQKHNLLVNLDQKNLLLLPVTSLQEGKVRKKAFLRFGTKAIEVDVASSKELASNELMISKHVIEELKIPLNSQYEVIENHSEIIIGPYIGILACKKQESLDNMVQNFSNYLYDYDEIGGAVITFAEESIDMENQLIHGYVYNPMIKRWESGTFPYPASLFRRSGLNQKLRNHFQSILGNKIFNNYIFNKWEMHEWLSNVPGVRPYLPETIRYRKASDVTWFLEHFSPIYLKPIFGSQGIGIIRGSKDDNGYTFKFKKEDKEHELTFQSEKEVHQFLKEIDINKRFLIQQGINVLNREASMIDFRLLLVKDYHGTWKDMGLVARYGVSGSIVSNVSSGGYASMGEVVFRDICHLSEEEVFLLRKKITDVAIHTAECMEKCGIHCGNLGFDLAIDTEFNLWIIELNNRDPNHTIAIDAGNKQLFYQTKKMNMLYAKKLAGF